MAAPDVDILKRARAGDRAALAELLEPEMDRVYATCRRMVGNPDDAAELAHDSIVRAIRGLGSFDGRSSLATWITRVTMNTCLSWHRARGRRAGRMHLSAENPDEIGGEPGSVGGVQPESGPADTGVRDRIEEALNMINPEQRAILVLRDIRGLDYDSIGAALDIPIGTVKSRIYRARAALRTGLESLGISDSGEGHS